MGMQPRAGGRYIVPLKSDGTEALQGNGRGVYNLLANTTYYAILGGDFAPFISATITGYTTALILTSVTVQDTDHPQQDITDISSTVGEWLAFTPSTAYVEIAGAGWTVGATGVVAVAGGAVGGARFNLAETAAYRQRLAIVVGGTGGDVRISGHGKD